MKILNSFSAQILTVFVAIMLPVMTWVTKTQVYTHPMITPLNDSELNAQLRGKEILVVGGTEGVGSALAHELHRRGSAITVTGADKSHMKHLPRGIEFVHSNISTMRGAQDLGENLLKGRRFDTVVFAGGFVPRPLVFTKGEGIEEDLETSYLSRYIVLRELLKNEALVGRRRVYILAYPGEDRLLTEFEDMWFGWSDYKMIPSWVNTVLFNDALIKEAARRYPALTVLGVNPGFLSRGGANDVHWAHKGLFSRLAESILTLGVKSPESYARNTLVQIVASPDLENKSGSYISDKMEDLPPKRWFSKEANWKTVWENSEKVVGKALGLSNGW